MQQNKTAKAALVTGGAIRLGKAIALKLAQNGYDIALHYNRSQDEAQDCKGEIEKLGVQCTLFRADLSDNNSLLGLVQDVVQQVPHLTTLVNSASGYIQADIASTDISTFDSMFATNIKAPFFLTQQFCKHVNRGVVINMIDNKINYNQFQYAAYLLAKKSLAEFTKMSALEFAPNFRINGIAPGVTLPASSRSQEYLQWRKTAIPLQIQGNTDNITDTVVFILNNEFISGQVINVDGAEGINFKGLNAGDYDQSKI